MCRAAHVRLRSATPPGYQRANLKSSSWSRAVCANAEIASRLLIFDKTAGHHVSAILRKLGVSNRGEASAAAVRLGLNGQPP